MVTRFNTDDLKLSLLVYCWRRLHSLGERLAKYKADSDWLLCVLSTKFPDCGIFDPNYRYVRMRQEDQVESLQINNGDGLFSFMGTLKSKQLKGRCSVDFTNADPRKKAVIKAEL